VTKWALVDCTGISPPCLPGQRDILASVLIVDDHPAIRRALRSAFERQPGFTVCGEAEDGFDAIGKAKNLRPDLIVLDLRMPVMDGLEAARELKRLFPQIPLMMLTCYHSSAAEKEALASGVTAVFSKPDGMQNLIWQARAVLKPS
jgi:DNA-binding NarL/FixJ family response regulator